MIHASYVALVNYYTAVQQYTAEVYFSALIFKTKAPFQIVDDWTKQRKLSTYIHVSYTRAHTQTCMACTAVQLARAAALLLLLLLYV